MRTLHISIHFYVNDQVDRKTCLFHGFPKSSLGKINSFLILTYFSITLNIDTQKVNSRKRFDKNYLACYTFCFVLYFATKWGLLLAFPTFYFLLFQKQVTRSPLSIFGPA